MAKLSDYKGSIDLISGIRPKNNGEFPLMEAHDILVGANDKRLDTALAELAAGGGGGGTAAIIDVEELPTEGINTQAFYRSRGKAYLMVNGGIVTRSAGADVITVDALPEEGIPLFNGIDDATLVTVYFLTSDGKAYGYTPLNDSQKWHEMSEFFPYAVVSSEADATEANMFYIVYPSDVLYHYFNGKWIEVNGIRDYAPSLEHDSRIATLEDRLSGLEERLSALEGGT